MKKQDAGPPKWANKLLQWLCAEEVLETLQGDLYELYQERLIKSGKRKASLLFYFDVLSAIRPFALKRFRKTKNNPWIMFYHNLVVANRNIWKNKTYSSINIVGLIIGLTAALLLGKYVGYTQLIDSSHVNRDQVYLVSHQVAENNVVKFTQNSTFSGFGSWAQQQFAEIKSTTKFVKHVEKLVTSVQPNGEMVKFNESGIFVADTAFFSMFSFDFIEGNPKEALLEPNTVVITEATAQKYFHNQKALGQSLTTSTSWGHKQLLKVTGVISEVPKHSSIQFDFLVSSIGLDDENPWEFAGFPTYIHVGETTDIEALQSKLNKEINQIKALKDKNKSVIVELHCVGKPEYSKVDYLLILVGIFTLIITWINFINLSTAQVAQRIKETGVRKAMGSNKSQLIFHFLFQGIILNTISFSGAILLSWLIYPYLSAFTNHRMLALFWDPTTVNLIFLATFFIGATISSLYPTLLVTGINPVKALKGNLSNITKGTSFRKALVIAQFCIAIILIIAITVIYQQMQFLQDQSLGIRLDQSLVIKTTKDGWDHKLDKFVTFKNQIRQLSAVDAVASSTTVPGSGAYQSVRYTINTKDKKVLSNLVGIDKHYIDYFGLNLLAGKSFEDFSFRANRQSLIINKTAAKLMGFENVEEAINQKIIQNGNGKTFTIIGVIDDFHQRSLKQKIPSMTFEFNPFRGNVAIRLDSLSYKNYKALGHSIDDIEQIWDKIYPDQSFDYYFLDEYFNAQYLADTKFKNIFSLFSATSILIACLGLFGLSIHIANKRKKEIGVRKVHGASSLRMILLFGRDYLQQVGTAILIGAPIAYLLMHRWLETYSYRTSMNLFTFLIPSIMLILIAFFTVSFQTIKASAASPANTLKEE